MSVTITAGPDFDLLDFIDFLAEGEVRAAFYDEHHKLLGEGNVRGRCDYSDAILFHHATINPWRDEPTVDPSEVAHVVLGSFA